MKKEMLCPHDDIPNGPEAIWNIGSYEDYGWLDFQARTREILDEFGIMNRVHRAAIANVVETSWRYNRYNEGLYHKDPQQFEKTFYVEDALEAEKELEQAQNIEQNRAKAEADIVVSVPPVWADDALARDLDIGIEIERTSKTVWLAMTANQLSEALSDARFYASTYGPATEPEYLGLRSSSRAAAKKLATAQAELFEAQAKAEAQAQAEPEAEAEAEIEDLRSPLEQAQDILGIHNFNPIDAAFRAYKEAEAEAKRIYQNYKNKPCPLVWADYVEASDIADALEAEYEKLIEPVGLSSSSEPEPKTRPIPSRWGKPSASALRLLDSPS